jgi:hypothetical protein
VPAAQPADPSADAVDWGSLSARASLASHRLIGWIYWDPVAMDNYTRLGLPEGAVTYIVSRAAPLAPAGHQAVAAAFYSINGAFIEASITIAAKCTTFDRIIEARNDAVGRGLRTYVPDIRDGLAELAEPLWQVVDALPGSGRVLFAAHRQQPRPTDDQVLSAWLALNCIREWRGDTHFAILVAERISGTQAGLLHNEFLNYPKDWIPRSRGADDAALRIAMGDLEARGLAVDGSISESGRELRARIETLTDTICEQAWRELGAARTDALLDLIEPVGPRLLERVDATAGPDWMPAARPRRR